MNKIAAIYGRYSSNLQDQTSIDGQFRNCEEFCERKGFEIVARFSDEGITGTDDSRPGYCALMEAVGRADVDVIVVDETSRLTRNPSTLLALLDTLAYRNQALLDCRGFDSTQESAMLLAGLYGGMDRMELDKIRARTHRGLRERAEGGHWTGGKVYGYRSVPVDPDDPKTRRRLVIDPEQAEIVELIFRSYAEGMSPKRIASMLNERGVPSPGSTWKRTKRRTRGWMHTAIVGTADCGSDILRNETYAGQIIWNKRRSKRVPGTSRRKFEMRPKSEWVIHDAPKLRIVPDNVWQRVRARLALNRRRAAERPQAGRGYHVSRYLLSGILQCGECGANFIMTDARSYQCSSHTNGGRHCCSNSQRVRRDVIEGIVLRGIKRDLLSDEALAEVRGALAKAQRDHKSRQATAQREIRKVEGAIERITNAIAEMGISRALREKLGALESERDELEAQQRVTQPDSDVAALLPRAMDRWRKLVDEMEHLGQHPDVRPEDIEEARERLAGLLGRVRIVAEDDHLVAEVGLQSIEIENPARGRALHIRMVAGAGFEPATFGL